MTQEYAIWKPEHDGHVPPNWREGMAWRYAESGRDHDSDPKWIVGITYLVPAEALNSPNDDAETPDAVETGKLENIVRGLRQYPAEELAKHGITLAPEKDVFVELFRDAQKAYAAARFPNEGAIAAAKLLRTRFEQMKGEG